MKTTSFSSKVVINYIKAVLCSSLVVTFFITMNINHIYDLIFMVVFVVLTFRFFTVKD